MTRDREFLAFGAQRIEIINVGKDTTTVPHAGIFQLKMSVSSAPVEKVDR